LSEKKPVEIPWPPDYKEEFARRAKMLARMKDDPQYVEALKVHYKNNPVDFINDWGMTYDPRNVGSDIPSLMPFCMFKRQEELIRWLKDRLDAKENCAVDKSRDEGATWLGCAFSWWLFLFHGGACVGWGSRKAELVDSRDDPKCIFDKIRTLLKYTPVQFRPPKRKYIDNLNKLINKENGATIIGEGGDNIGRGGRTLIYFKDESAFYEHPEKIEAALGENSSCQVDISTHNGTNTVYYRAIKNYPPHRVFVLDWSHDPRKTQKWFDDKRKEYRLKGLDAEFAREIERDPRGSVENVVIPAHWVRAAIDAHIKLGFGDKLYGDNIASLDIADAGIDRNAVCHRYGWIIKSVKTWEFALDTAVSLDKTISHMMNWGVRRLIYDGIGIGAGIKGDVRQRHERNEVMWLTTEVFNAANSPVYKDREFMDGQTNGQFFRNRKAQGWWELRLRFLKTYLALTEDEVYPPEEMISISSDVENREVLIDELAQPTYSSASGKIVIDKKPDHSKSPNCGDCTMISFAPRETHEMVSTGIPVGLY